MAAERSFSIYFVDVGQGDATVLMPPEGAPIVFDCADGFVVRQLLSNWGVSRIRALIASHLDWDHVAGFADLIGHFGRGIEAVYWSVDREITDASEASAGVKAIHDTLISGAGSAEGDGLGWSLQPVYRRRSPDGSVEPAPIANGEDWSVSLLCPEYHQFAAAQRSGRFEDANTYSAILRIVMGGQTVLVGGDAPLRTWSQLPVAELSANTFRVPHHGGAIDDGGIPDGWSANRMYDEIKPQHAVISVGSSNAHGHPRFDTWAAPLVGRTGCQLLCTQVTARCHTPFGGEGAREAIREFGTSRDILGHAANGVSHFTEMPWRHLDSNARRRTSRPEVPCAGTVVVRIMLGGEIVVDPSESNMSFRSRVASWTNPRCAE